MDKPRCGWLVSLLGLALLSLGCGTTQSKNVTEQLLVSDAVDRAVQQLDFSDLTGRTVYLDDTYLQPVVNPNTFVNANYVKSSLRQHLVASQCFLQEKSEDAEIIVEPRLGAMGSDAHEVVYGIPANNTISNAANLLPNSPGLPALPEIAAGKTSMGFGAAKLAVFAYERESRDPIWQSGMLIGRSNSKDVWILGAGPIQSGTIYSSARFAGQRLAWIPGMRPNNRTRLSPVPYMAELSFSKDSPTSDSSQRWAELPTDDSSAAAPIGTGVSSTPASANSVQPATHTDSAAPPSTTPPAVPPPAAGETAAPSTNTMLAPRNSPFQPRSP